MVIRAIDIEIEADIFKNLVQESQRDKKEQNNRRVTYMTNCFVVKWKSVYKRRSYSEEAHLDPYSKQRLADMRAWIRNYIHGFLWDVITHPSINCNSG